ncbi:MAG: hypothetical protein WDW36_004624 [Sanguina aurantia]
MRSRCHAAPLDAHASRVRHSVDGAGGAQPADEASTTAVASGGCDTPAVAACQGFRPLLPPDEPAGRAAARPLDPASVPPLPAALPDAARDSSSSVVVVAVAPPARSYIDAWHARHPWSRPTLPTSRRAQGPRAEPPSGQPAPAGRPQACQPPTPAPTPNPRNPSSASGEPSPPLSGPPPGGTWKHPAAANASPSPACPPLHTAQQQQPAAPSDTLPREAPDDGRPAEAASPHRGVAVRVHGPASAPSRLRPLAQQPPVPSSAEGARGV